MTFFDQYIATRHPNSPENSRNRPFLPRIEIGSTRTTPATNGGLATACMEFLIDRQNKANFADLLETTEQFMAEAALTALDHQNALYCLGEGIIQPSDLPADLVAI